MTNYTPYKDSDLLTAAQDLATGEEAIGNELDVAQNKAVKILADINDLTGKRAGYEIAKDKLADYRAAIRSVFDDGKIHIGLTRDVFKPRFGNEFSDKWKLLGFEDSLSLPSTPAQLQLVMKVIQKYLADNPTQEVAPLNITAVHAQLLLDQISAARGAVYNQEMVVGTAREARDASAEQLRRRYRGFIDEVSQLIGPSDQRWKAFGLNIPDGPQTPEVPTNITAVLIGANAAAIKWGASPRANYYRVFYKLHGSTGDYVAAGSPGDLDFTLENLPLASTLDIVISAVNDAGESQKSEVATITTH